MIAAEGLSLQPQICRATQDARRKYLCVWLGAGRRAKGDPIVLLRDITVLCDVSKFDPQFRAEGQAGDVTTRSRVEKADAPRGLWFGLLLPSSRTVQCTFSYLKANTFTLTREFAASVPSLLLSSADSQIAWLRPTSIDRRTRCDCRSLLSCHTNNGTYDRTPRQGDLVSTTPSRCMSRRPLIQASPFHLRSIRFRHDVAFLFRPFLYSPSQRASEQECCNLPYVSFNCLYDRDCVPRKSTPDKRNFRSG